MADKRESIGKAKTYVLEKSLTLENKTGSEGHINFTVKPLNNENGYCTHIYLRVTFRKKFSPYETDLHLKDPLKLVNGGIPKSDATLQVGESDDGQDTIIAFKLAGEAGKSADEGDKAFEAYKKKHGIANAPTPAPAPSPRNSGGNQGGGSNPPPTAGPNRSQRRKGKQAAWAQRNGKGGGKP